MSLAILIPLIIYLISFTTDIDISDEDFVKGMFNEGYTPKEIADETGLDMSEVLKLLS